MQTDEEDIGNNHLLFLHQIQANCTTINEDSSSSTSNIPAFKTSIINQYKQTKNFISNRKCYSFHRKEFRRKNNFSVKLWHLRNFQFNLKIMYF